MEPLTYDQTRSNEAAWDRGGLRYCHWLFPQNDVRAVRTDEGSISERRFKRVHRLQEMRCCVQRRCNNHYFEQGGYRPDEL